MSDLRRVPSPTYTRRSITEIMPADGWRYVCWDWDTQTHEVEKLHALGLGFGTDYTRNSHQKLPRERHRTPLEDWEIYGLRYSLDGTWDIVEMFANFCGLLPPETTLDEFESHGMCENAHRSFPRIEGMQRNSTQDL